MTQYRRKPQLIEAFQWTGGIDQNEDPVWAVEALRDGRLKVLTSPAEGASLLVRSTSDRSTLSARRPSLAYPGDWLYRLEFSGDITVYSDSEFLALYEPA